MTNEQIRVAEAYLEMAITGRYRPMAPGDGLGSIEPSPEELADRVLLKEEAIRYAEKFTSEEQARCAYIGVPNYRTNRALVYVVEAARLLCGTDDKTAKRLLSMAISEISAAQLQAQAKGQ